MKVHKCAVESRLLFTASDHKQPTVVVLNLDCLREFLVMWKVCAFVAALCVASAFSSPVPIVFWHGMGEFLHY